MKPYMRYAELPEETKQVLIKWGVKILLRELKRREGDGKDSNCVRPTPRAGD